MSQEGRERLEPRLTQDQGRDKVVRMDNTLEIPMQCFEGTA